MIVYYVHTFRDSWWPNGKLAPNRPVRSDEVASVLSPHFLLLHQWHLQEKASTKEAAKEKLLKNIPGWYWYWFIRIMQHNIRSCICQAHWMVWLQDCLTDQMSLLFSSGSAKLCWTAKQQTRSFEGFYLSLCRIMDSVPFCWLVIWISSRPKSKQTHLLRT